MVARGPLSEEGRLLDGAATACTAAAEWRHVAHSVGGVSVRLAGDGHQMRWRW